LKITLRQNLALQVLQEGIAHSGWLVQGQHERVAWIS
jgi:hypothetical protein